MTHLLCALISYLTLCLLSSHPPISHLLHYTTLDTLTKPYIQHSIYLYIDIPHYISLLQFLRMKTTEKEEKRLQRNAEQRRKYVQRSLADKYAQRQKNKKTYAEGGLVTKISSSDPDSNRLDVRSSEPPLIHKAARIREKYPRHDPGSCLFWQVHLLAPYDWFMEAAYSLTWQHHSDKLAFRCNAFIVV